MNFTHLHGHSTFSFLEAIGKPAAIVNKAKELGMSAIAITDYNGMYGIVKFYQTAKEAGIKPIIGVEIGFVMDNNSQIPEQHIGNIVIIAKSKEGYQSLMELTSLANKEAIKGKGKIDLQTLKTFGKDIICIFGGANSRIGKMIALDERESKMIEIIHLIEDTIGKENVYLEIIAQDYNENTEHKKTNEVLLAIAEKENIGMVVNNNYFYPSSTDKQAREVALAIKDGLKIYDENRRKPKGQFHIMNEEEIRMILEHNGYEKNIINQLIDTNNKIAENINVEIDLNQSLFPNYETPEEVKDLYEQYKDRLVEEE
ncbi:MAG TPA: PHP domain-containing protein [Candidatus Absconditabacterales bacterium]|nr:PHP domain-containing protein [Candidatus Absconditabacterales bacterium]